MVDSVKTGGRLAGRTAIVTGGSRGLGQAIAMAFAAEGASVAVTARTEAVWDERLPGTIHDTVASIEERGGQAIAIAADLAQEEDIERVVTRTRDEFGPVDILVNNAALTVGGRPPAPGTQPKRPVTAVQHSSAPSFSDVPVKGYRLHFTIDLFAPYRLMQLVLPDMIKLGRGSIVNVSSVAALTPGEGPYENPGTPALFGYGSAKAALHNLTQAVAIEMAPHGVAANVLIPSLPIPTPGTVSLLEGTTLKDWASAEEFAEAAVQVVLAAPTERTGQILYHEDVLHPELGVRGYRSTEV